MAILKGYKNRNPYALKAYLFLHLLNPNKKFNVGIVTKPEQIKKVFRFRYEVYCERDKLLNAQLYPNKVERDKHDDVSTQIAAINKDKEIVGTLRVIKNTDLGLPSVDEFNLHDKISNIPKNEIVEVSRFATAANERGGILLLELSKLLYLYSRKNGIQHWVGCAEKWFINKLDFLFGPLDYLGDPEFCFNAMNYPFLLSVKNAEENVKESNKTLYKYVTRRTNNLYF